MGDKRVCPVCGGTNINMNGDDCAACEGREWTEEVEADYLRRNARLFAAIDSIKLSLSKPRWGGGRHGR